MSSTTPAAAQATDPTFASATGSGNAGPLKWNPADGSVSVEHTQSLGRSGPLAHQLVCTQSVGASRRGADDKTEFGLEMEFRQGQQFDAASSGRNAASLSSTSQLGERARYNVTLPGDASAEAARAVNPFDPLTIPVNGSVRLDGQAFVRTSLETAFRSFASSSEHTDAAGVSYTAQRLDPCHVRVAIGPTEAIERIGMLGLKTPVAQAMLGRQDALGQASMHTATFDLRDRQAQAAYRDFLGSGQLPAQAPGVSDAQRIDTLSMSSQTRAKLGLGPLSLDLAGQRTSGEDVRATQVDGSSTVTSKLQYADNVPLTLTRQFDAAGSEHVAARRYQLGFGKVDANQAQLLNAALARKDADDDAIAAGQDLSLNFSEAQMGALRQQYAQAAQARPFDREQAGAYARMSNQAFALDLARTLSNSPHGLSERLLHVAADADVAPSGAPTRIDAGIDSPAAATRIAPTNAPSDPRDPAHPDHAMQRMIDARLTPADPQLATHLLLAARREGLTRIDHVLRNDAGRVFAVQGDPMSADKRTAYVDAQVATATPLQDSVRQLNALNATVQQSAVAAAQETPAAAQRAPAR
ncbi:XVIPCD domain-containing protein [Xanthomonas translucens]|uniref:XVIPCD domain-containing protein n=1 Tax=Xanthomonas campestris pv. translucens TaxID=343 RepID=UPI00071E955C|nr:XVIPCD domain-containing protein [Xanthomonas translucens]